jgi:DNA-binding GntR family transcriptional regulator
VAVTEEASSRSESIYLDLRRRLLSGYYQANHRLKLSDLCAEKGVSVSVVREALTRLAEQGLIQSQPNKGFFVPLYTPEEINDLAFIRMQVESLAVRLSIERGNAAWEASVVATHHELGLTPRVPAEVDAVAGEQWSRAHAAFHAACAAACGSPRLIRLRQRLYDEAEAVRQMAGLSGGRSRDIEDEHATLAKAIVARNAERAADLTIKHIEITASLSVKSALARVQGER